MIGELYIPHDMPELPKKGFFEGLFAAAAKPLERDELCELN